MKGSGTMANDIAIIKDNWLDLADRLKDMPMPFQRDVFLAEFGVAGTLHIDDILIRTEGIAVGNVLVLKREAGNEHDVFAIRVETANGDKIGYVPNQDSPILARLMDAGKLLVARVVHKELEDYLLNIRIAVDMKEV